MKKQRIAVLSVHTSPLASLGGKKTGGMNVYIRDFCRELGGRGISVDVFTRIQDATVPSIQIDDQIGGDHVRVINLPAGPPTFIPPMQVANHLDQFVEGVIAFTEQHKITYDIVHGHYWLSGVAAGYLRQRSPHYANAPIVQMFHTLGHMKNAIAPNPAHHAPQARIDGETAVIQTIADHLIAATPAEQSQLISRYGADPAKISVIPPGTDTSRFTAIDSREAKVKLGLNHTDNAKMVLLVGRIEPLKGIDTFVEAATLIKPTHPDTQFVVIGGNPDQAPLSDEMHRLIQLNSQNQVMFVGAKDQDTLPLWYSAADIVAMPSHYESFGLVALEAMMMRIPVVASNVGGLTHLVIDGETGYHISPRDPAALADKLTLLLSDDALRQTLGEQAYQHAQTYSWSHIVDQLLAVYAML